MNFLTFINYLARFLTSIALITGFIFLFGKIEVCIYDQAPSVLCKTNNERTVAYGLMSTLAFGVNFVFVITTYGKLYTLDIEDFYKKLLCIYFLIVHAAFYYASSILMYPNIFTQITPLSIGIILAFGSFCALFIACITFLLIEMSEDSDEDLLSSDSMSSVSIHSNEETQNEFFDAL